MKRNREALFLPQSPLVFTLGVVQFDPVLAVANYIPEIQESLRKQGFPKVRKRTITHRIVPTENSRLQTESKDQWEFHNPSNRTSIMVDQDAVIVQTTEYSTYEKFHKYFELALSCAVDRLAVAEVLRCGLRYIDIVDVSEKDNISNWVRPELLGMSTLDGFQRKHSHSTTELSNKDGSTLRIRATLVPHGIILPPDLLPCDLEFMTNPVRKEPFVLLDLDHFSLTSFSYKQKTTLEHLTALHDGLDLAFRKSVTSNAIEQWKKKL